MLRKTSTFAILLLSCGISGWAQNVGIGTTTPQAQLHIQIASSYTLPALLVDVKGSTTPHLVITPDGKVGIGIAGPTEKLDVNGNIQFSGALMPAGNAGTAGQVLISQGPGSSPQWQTATFGDDWGNQVAQTQSPIIGDGTTASPVTLVNGSASGDILQWDGSSWQLVSIASAVSTAGFDSVCSGTANNYVQKWTGTNLCNSQIYDDGTNVGIGTASPSYKLHVNGRIKSIGINETSDKRLKKDISDIHNALGLVLKLEGVYYKWLDSLVQQGYPSTLQVGFIAQQVKEVLPVVVEQDKEGYYSVEYTRIVPFLVEAMKELYEQNQRLQEEVKTLRAIIEATTDEADTQTTDSK